MSVPRYDFPYRYCIAFLRIGSLSDDDVLTMCAIYIIAASLSWQTVNRVFMASACKIGFWVELTVTTIPLTDSVLWVNSQSVREWDILWMSRVQARMWLLESNECTEADIWQSSGFNGTPEKLTTVRVWFCSQMESSDKIASNRGNNK